MLSLFQMPLSTDLDLSDLPRLTDRDLPGLKGKIVLFDRADKVPLNATRLVKGAPDDKFFTGSNPEYFFASQLPDNVVILCQDVDRTARTGISRMGKMGLVIDQNQVVLSIF